MKTNKPKSKRDYKITSWVYDFDFETRLTIYLLPNSVTELFIFWLLIYSPITHALCSLQELSKERKELILKLVSGLLDGMDNSMLAGDLVSLEEEEPIESHLEERAVYNRLAQLPQRDRKAPCKNFFWKTFTSC